MNTQQTTRKRLIRTVTVTGLAALIPFAGSASASSGFSSFFEDGRVVLRNATKHEGYQRWNPEKEKIDYRHKTASVFTAGFRSGYVGSGLVKMGFDVGAIAAVDLGSYDWHNFQYWDNNNSMLAQDNCNVVVENNREVRVCDSTKGYSRMSVASTKIRIGDAYNKRADIQMGLGHYQGGLIKTNDPDTSLAPNSYRGFNVRGRWGSFEYNAVWADRYMRNGDSSLQTFKSYDYERRVEAEVVEIPYVYGFELARRNRTSALSFATGFSKDYKSRYTLFGRKTIPLAAMNNLEFKTSLQTLKYGGDLWKESVRKGINLADETHSRLVDLSVRWYNNNWSVALGHAITGGNAAFIYGFDGANGVIYDSGKGEAMSYFRRAGDKQYSVKTSYTFRGEGTPRWLENWQLYHQYHYFVRPDAAQETAWDGNGGKIILSTARATAYENVLGVLYRMPNGRLKGMTIKVYGAMYSPDKYMNGENAKEGDPKDRWDIGRFVAEFRMPIF